ncbi:glutathione S-transferase 1 isoform X3 [Anoplophora glabripennis]|uniref:glutathione S-transferase 1 isoform X3 n=1 Tax=Anoplophora glabripennis TaxID=217634 RepID=UPI0008746C49|nr:glutathione S-transferase 1 isoform X3 [Anoplophora glabripennis]
MSSTIYGFKASPPVRACLMTIEALGIDVELEEVNVLNGDHLKPEYLQLNPLHTIPTLRDRDVVIWDSHVINAYLVGKYGKDDSLYPKDLQKRAVVDQRMVFDVDILFNKFRTVVFPVIKLGATSVDKAKAADLEGAYNSLETLLERSTYVAGEQVTIADFSIVTTLTSANVLVPVASNRFPKISEWLVKMQALPYYASANQVGLDQFAAVVKSKLA